MRTTTLRLYLSAGVTVVALGGASAALLWRVRR